MGVDLARFRLIVGVTQQEIANQTGLSQATICRIEKKTQNPSGKALLSIQDWADQIASQKRIPMPDRLSWDWLRSWKAA